MFRNFWSDVHDFTPSSDSWSFLSKASSAGLPVRSHALGTYVRLTCLCILISAATLLQDVRGTDLLKAIPEDVNELLTSDVAEVCIESAHFQVYLKDSMHQLPTSCRQYQKHTAKGHQGRMIMVACSCYMQTQKGWQQLTSFMLRPTR